MKRRGEGEYLVTKWGHPREQREHARNAEKSGLFTHLVDGLRVEKVRFREHGADLVDDAVAQRLFARY
jgi:hypothetical protein